MATRQRRDFIQRGLTQKQMGVYVAPVSATAGGLPLSLTTRFIHLRAPNGNTDTVWVGLTHTVNSLTGYGLQSGTVVELPIDATTATLFMQSQGGSSVVHYIALGSP